MALKDLIAAIQQDADKEAAKIRAAAEKHAGQKRQAYTQEERTAEQNTVTHADLAAQAKREQEQFKLRAASRNQLLSKQREILDRTYAAAVDQLAALPAGEQEKLLARLLKSIPGTTGRVLATKTSRNHVQKALKASGKPFSLATETVKGAGGFVYQTDTVDIDSRYETLVRRVRSETVSDVGSILFSSNG